MISSTGVTTMDLYTKVCVRKRGKYCINKRNNYMTEKNDGLSNTMSAKEMDLFKDVYVRKGGR